MKSGTQAEAILNYLQEHGSITSWTAIQELGCTRLSAQIFNLRKLGYNIESKPLKVETRYGSKTTIAEYTLVND